MRINPQMINAVFVGDQLVDTASSLGIYSRAMSTSIIPMIETKYPCCALIECTRCVMTVKHKFFIKIVEKMAVERIVLEDNGNEALNPASMAGDLRQKGFQVDVVDFSSGILNALAQAGRIFNREKEAQKVVLEYEKDMQAVQALMNRNLGKRVLVLLGITNPHYKDGCLLVEDPDTDVDKKILSPLGCINVGNYCMKTSENCPQDTPIRLIDSLEGIQEAAPDIIALTGDPSPAMLALNLFVNTSRDADNVPAIRSQAIFTLPNCNPGEPLSQPKIQKLWCDALFNAR